MIKSSDAMNIKSEEEGMQRKHKQKSNNSPKRDFEYSSFPAKELTSLLVSQPND